MERYGLEEKRNQRQHKSQHSKSYRGGKGPRKGGFKKKSHRGDSDGRGSHKSKRPREHNPGDLRRANRTDRERSPEIDDDVTGRELSQPVNRQLGALDDRNRKWVAKHLVMAGRLLEDDPELAFEHALAASRRGGRLGVVREAVDLAAYAAGEFSEALREFRTYRRITGDNSHLAEMVDCERALDRREKALETASEVDPESLPVRSRIELAMVVSGIYQDLGDPEAAVASLQIPELNPKRGFAYSPRLFSAYADALEFAGDSKQAGKWRALSSRAARALGQDVEPDPVIFDVADDLDDVEDTPRAKDVVPSKEKSEASTESPSVASNSYESSESVVADQGEKPSQPEDAATDTEPQTDAPSQPENDSASETEEAPEDDGQEKLW